MGDRYYTDKKEGRKNTDKTQTRRKEDIKQTKISNNEDTDKTHKKQK
jgi:hypothetical protein